MTIRRKRYALKKAGWASSGCGGHFDWLFSSAIALWLLPPHKSSRYDHLAQELPHPCILRTYSKRLFVTMIELLIVIAVLAMVAGVVGVNIRRAFFEQRFRAEVSQVVDSFRLAQDLMLILNSDVHVRFTKNPAGGIVHSVEVEKPLTTSWERELRRIRPPLTAIHLVEPIALEEDKTALPAVPGVLDIKFLSGGLVMTKGAIGLFSGGDKQRSDVLKSTICLPGYPKAIESLQGYHPDACVEPKEKEMIDLATRDMLSEIQPKLQKQAPVEEKKI